MYRLFFALLVFIAIFSCGGCNPSEDLSPITPPQITDPPNPPIIDSFTASSYAAPVGMKVTISWVTRFAEKAYILYNGKEFLPSVSASGSKVVDPTENGVQLSTYTLVVTNQDGKAEKTLTIRTQHPKVLYKVTGVPKSSLITMSVEGGSIVQFADVELPFTREVKEVSTGDYLYVSAQNAGTDGCITVEIYKDGKFFKHATSCGAYVIATASGSY